VAICGLTPVASLLETRVDEAFRSRLDAKLADFREWSRHRTLTCCRLVHYCGVECIGARDVALADTQSQIEGLLCEGFHVDWMQHEERLYFRVWESDRPEPLWPKVFAEEHLADVKEILRQAGHLT
jgi:hypothetical protein